MRIAMWLDSPLSRKQIAEVLGMKPGTYISYQRRLYLKLHARSRIEAIQAWDNLGRNT